MAFRSSRRTGAPTMSAIIGSTIAVAAVAVAVTFGVNLDRLVDTPALYGWAWDAQVGGGFDGIATRPARAALDGMEPVEAYTGGNSSQLAVRPDGQERAVPVPALGLDPLVGDLYPPVVEGRRVTSPDEVVLGGITMEELGVGVGDTVVAELPGAVEPSELEVVGRAVLPAIGAGNFATTGLGRGALVAGEVFDDPQEPGKYTYFLVDYAPGVDREAADQELQLAIEEIIPDDCADLHCVDRNRRPGEIRDYDRVRSTPLVLATVLGLLGIAVLTHTLVTGVRRHRRDLGVLAALGFVRRQIASTTAWQAITVAGVSLLVGIPVGVAGGRFVWGAFADHLGVVVPAQSPVTAILIAIPVTIVLAVAVSLPPAFAAARTHPSEALRSE
jgi:hypothetical protein